MSTSIGEKVKGQLVIVPGSRSGAKYPIFKDAVSSDFRDHFLGEAKQGTKDSANSWYIERVQYSADFTTQTCLVSMNEIYLRPSTVDVTDLGGNSVDVVLNSVGAEISEPEVNDTFKLSTASNPNLQGLITSITGSTITIKTAGTTVANESGTVVGNTAISVILKGNEKKSWENRVWDLRAFYLYS